MLKTPSKLLLVVLLLTLHGGQVAHAQNKVYQYDGKLPFVQMMLNMMVAMGILDRLPANNGYGGSSAFGNSSPWAQSPWSPSTNAYSNAGAASSAWGSPSWGVLPAESYASKYSPYDPRGVSPEWSSTDLSGWVNETWETSSWNPEGGRKGSQSQKSQAQNSEARQSIASQGSAPPLVQNFNYNVTPNNVGPNGVWQEPMQQEPMQQELMQQGQMQQGQMQQGQRRYSNAVNNSPLAKLSRPNAPMQRPVQQRQKPSPLQKRANAGVKQKPCVTDYCGMKKPELDGLWVAKNGEMLGVKNHRYLWSDSSSRYLTGQLKVQNEYLLANVDGHEKIMRFKYKLAGNHLLTLQPDGKIREFVRMRPGRSSSRYPSQGFNPTSGTNYYYQ